MKKLARYKEIAGKLAHAEGVSEQEARALAKEGKAIVWIDGGLHATETVGSQQLMEWVYQMVSRTDEETMRFLNDVIVLNVQANPDGQELVANWYMREKDPLEAQHERPAAALRQVRRARRQSRFLHVQHEGIHQHEPPVVHRVVSADHVQPPPDRTRRRGGLHPAVPRSVQLQFRSAGAAGHRDGGHRDAQPPGGRGQGRQRHAHRRQLFHLVERRAAHRHLFPQHDRHPDRDHRQSDADADSGGRRQAASAGRLAACPSCRRNGTTASRSITR